MQKIDRLRPRLARLWWPTLVLGVCSATYGFFAGKELEQTFAELLYALIGLAAFFLWLLPSLSYLGTWLDLYETQVVSRKGIFGARRIVPFADIEDITGSVTKGVIINVKLEKPLILKGYPKPKVVAARLIALAK